MGDPKKIKKKFAKPRHPWQKARIEEENILTREYGLKNKREIYHLNALVSRIIDHFKSLNVVTSAQAQLEKDQLLARVKRLGLIDADKDLSSILDLRIKNALDRRLQTLVFKKKLARTIKQSRQFITHRHVLVNGIVVDAPGYIVPVADENAIAFIPRSPLFSEMHPERAAKEIPGAAATVAQESIAASQADKSSAATQDAKATEEAAPIEIEVDEAEEQ